MFNFTFQCFGPLVSSYNRKKGKFQVQMGQFMQNNFCYFNFYSKVICINFFEIAIFLLHTSCTKQGTSAHNLTLSHIITNVTISPVKPDPRAGCEIRFLITTSQFQSYTCRYTRFVTAFPILSEPRVWVSYSYPEPCCDTFDCKSTNS